MRPFVRPAPSSDACWVPIASKISRVPPWGTKRCHGHRIESPSGAVSGHFGLCLRLVALSRNTSFYHTIVGTRLSIRGESIKPRATLVSACTGNIACAVGGPIRVVLFVVLVAQQGATWRIKKPLSAGNSSISDLYVFGRAGLSPVGDARCSQPLPVYDSSQYPVTR